MTRGRGTASIVASPVLVGAVTTLIVIVSVFLAYNANTGLPFVPTYNLKAELPTGANLVPGNEVRIGGFRVGIIDKLSPGTTTTGGKPRAIAIVRMKLDKSSQPLAVDSAVIVGPPPAAGPKYIQITPRRSRPRLRDGAPISLTKAPQPGEVGAFPNPFGTRA